MRPEQDVRDAAATGVPAQGAEEQRAEAPAPKRRGARRAVVAVVIVAVCALVGFGGLVAYAGTDAFCMEACHTPMGGFADTYDATAGEPDVDKWGNPVDDASSMLATTHRDWNAADCATCHPQDLNRRITQVGWWLTGDYYFPLEEWKTSDMAEYYGTDEDGLCLNENCHNVTRGELREMTNDTRLNPHSNRHGDIACSTCHKAHRASVLQCAGCHAAEDDLGAGHLRATADSDDPVVCVDCHVDSPELKAVHETEDTEELAYEVSAEACLECHDQAELAASTADSVAILNAEGAPVNPHTVHAPEMGADIDCLSCHAGHDGAVDEQTCYTCHHTKTIEGCATCHRSPEAYKDRCIGCKYCYQACPFGVPQYNDEAMDKCDCCLGAGVKPGEQTWCARACKFDALRYGLIDDLLAACPEATVVQAPTKPSLLMA